MNLPEGCSIVTVSDAEMKRREKRLDREWIDEALRVAVEFPIIYSMTTRDCRKFLCFGSGESALHYLEDTPGQYNLSKTEYHWIAKQAGAIVEVGSDDPVMWYEDFNKLTAAWLELHEICDVRMTYDEQVFTDHYYLDDGNDED
jgi:hypothetical protein